MTRPGEILQSPRADRQVADASEDAQDLADDIWAIALNASACRRWLARDPPRFDEVVRTLQVIASGSQAAARQALGQET